MSTNESRVWRLPSGIDGQGAGAIAVESECGGYIEDPRMNDEEARDLGAALIAAAKHAGDTQ